MDWPAPMDTDALKMKEKRLIRQPHSYTCSAKKGDECDSSTNTPSKRLPPLKKQTRGDAMEELTLTQSVCLSACLSVSLGVHTLQRMFGCELDDDGTTRGYDQYGYDGEDFISLNLKTATWTAAKPQAEIFINNWDSRGQEAKYWKDFLQHECIHSLKKYMSYGRETLNRKGVLIFMPLCVSAVRPEASVLQKHSPSAEVVCHATGFFPKAVVISWQKDGEEVHENVELRETLPNQDGSFQKRSILTVPAEELQKHTYTCVIQHSSLEKELVLPVRDGGSDGGSDEVSGGGSDGGSDGAPIAVIVAVVAALVALVAVVAGIVVWKKKNSDFKPVPPNSMSSSEEDSSSDDRMIACLPAEPRERRRRRRRRWRQI
ncbi:popy Class I histocompatibility antigen, A-1 alpha chain-like [Pangasianodon hypophthalmus]|uniref:popy Class I histocompatibility antigen, A-1 alpha chain-like n=1 Tax=Pangasianodon hypophthalmus TaxID=310915 RepID=UPI00230816F9|nr:popy Class I histocompatibility antigen, A-1 alpha chain-like [Pangasianodon hypophthalmus]